MQRPCCSASISTTRTSSTSSCDAHPFRFSLAVRSIVHGSPIHANATALSLIEQTALHPIPRLIHTFVRIRNVMLLVWVQFSYLFRPVPSARCGSADRYHRWRGQRVCHAIGAMHHVPRFKSCNLDLTGSGVNASSNARMFRRRQGTSRRRPLQKRCI